ncbi:MAG: hypothetical protein QM757_08205 [Paludibaculum sp.]
MKGIQSPPLPDGFYEYKYLLQFTEVEPREITVSDLARLHLRELQQVFVFVEAVRQWS